MTDQKPSEVKNYLMAIIGGGAAGVISIAAGTVAADSAGVFAGTAVFFVACAYAAFMMDLSKKPITTLVAATVGLVGFAVVVPKPDRDATLQRAPVSVTLSCEGAPKPNYSNCRPS